MILRALTILLALMTLLLSGCGGDDEANSVSHGPRLYASKTAHDFGTVFADSVRSATFELENRGNGELVIARALKDCGCTQPTFTRKRLKPGEKSIMTVTLIAPIFHGQMNKRIRVFTNDPNQEESVFRIHMQGMGRAHVSPQTIELGAAKKMIGPALAFPFELVLPENRPILDVSVVADSPFVSARLKEGRETDRGIVEILIQGLREPLKFRDYLQLEVKTRDKTGKVVTVHPQGIQLKGHLEPFIAASPALIDLGRVKPHQACELRSMLKIATSDVIKAVTFEDQGSLEVVRSESSGSTMAEHVRVMARPGRLFAVAKVVFASGAEIEIPILAWVEPQSR